MDSAAAAIGYLRVSTATQAEEGYGLQVQEQAIRGYCERSGFELVAIFADEGISGTKDVEGRPGLAATLAALEGSAKVLVVAKLDRLARALHTQEAILAHVWRSGARVFTVEDGELLEDDPDDPMRTAMRQMRGVFSQLERATITARMSAGRRYKASQGGYAGYGSPRFGQRSEGGQLMTDGEEQRVIARMRALRERGLSYKAVATALNAEGLRPKRGERWHMETVRRVLRRLDAAREDEISARLRALQAEMGSRLAA